MHWPLWRVAVAEWSMEPALRPGDWLLTWRGFGVGGRSPGDVRVRRRPLRVRPGQLVVARHPDQPDLLLVKRAAWAEPEGWWLDSDNPRAGAVDSARFGLVRPELIEGRVLCRYRRARLFRAASAHPGKRACERAGRIR